MKWRLRAKRWLTILGENNTYLIHDTFTTDRAAGAVNGTSAEPGPGIRTATDTNSKLTISADAFSCATGGVGQGDPGLWYPALTREAGRFCVAEIAQTSGGLHIGFDSAASGQLSDGVRPNVSTPTLTINNNNGSAITVGTSVSAAVYRVATVLRATGAVFLIKGDAFANWTLLYVSSGGNYAPLPGIAAVTSTTIGTVNYYRIPATTWLPAPLASDSFPTTWGTTNGNGHAETSGLGSGGSGIAWANVVGTFTVTSGAANASALSGGIAIAVLDTATASVIATAKVTRSVGSAGIVVRYADSSNYVYALHNGTNAQLIKVVAGTPTTLVNTAATYSAGAELRIICDATKFRLYYNNVFIGTEQTIADAGLASGTKQGLYTSDTSNTLDDFVVYARGTGGEYSALDAF